MDLKSLKEKALKLKEKASEKIWEAVSFSAKKLQKSKAVITETKKLEEFIEKSKNKKTSDGREIKKRVLILFIDKNSDFYEEALYIYPLIYTKAWSQNMGFSMSSIDLKDLKNYKIKKSPSLVLFENNELKKTIEWEENIKKVVKSLSLDINTTIDNL